MPNHLGKLRLVYYATRSDTGMYRSGTTLLHHLLDAHVELNVFPVENCVIRDTLFQHQLPHASKRSLEPLTQLITQGKI